MVYQCSTVSVCLSVRFTCHTLNLRTPWPIHFKFHRVIGIDDRTVFILYGEISNFIIGFGKTQVIELKSNMGHTDGHTDMDKT
jgi:hypothetical protein